MKKIYHFLTVLTLSVLVVLIIVLLPQCGCGTLKQSGTNLEKKHIGEQYGWRAENKELAKEDIDLSSLNLVDVGPKKVKGKIVLKKSLIEKEGYGQQPILRQSDFTKPNVNYIIEYDFNLNGECIILPENCNLIFDGGSLNNGILIGNNTSLEYKGIVFNKIRILGNWNVPEIHSYIFGDITSECNRLKDVFALTNSKIENVVYIEKGNYTLDVNRVTEHLLPLNSNTTVYFNGTINVKNNSFPNYRIFSIFNAENVRIIGSGVIIGDRDTHDFVPEAPEPESVRGKMSSHELGHGIQIKNSHNVEISGISITKCIGDGICISGNDITCSNLTIEYCRRQGISVIKGAHINIEDCNISNIWGVNHAGFGIDLEPDDDYHANDIYISNCNIYSCNGGINCQSHTFESVHDIIISDSHLSVFAQDKLDKHEQYRAFMCTGSCSISINNCLFEDSNNLISITGARDIHIMNSRFITRGANYCAYYRDNRGLVHLEKNKFFMYEKKSETPRGVVFLNLHNTVVTDNEFYSESLSRSNLNIECENVVLRGNIIDAKWEPNIDVNGCIIENNVFKKKVVIGKINNTTVERNSMPAIKISTSSNSKVVSNKINE